MRSCFYITLRRVLLDELAKLHKQDNVAAMRLAQSGRKECMKLDSGVWLAASLPTHFSTFAYARAGIGIHLRMPDSPWKGTASCSLNL